MIDLATQDDVPRLLPMMADFNAGERIAWTPESGEAPLRRLVASPELGLVGVIDGGAGYLVLTWGFDLEWGGRDAFLTDLYLVPERRGRGLGRAALDAIEELARSRGARALHLLVRHDNGPAAALYRRAGFVTPPRAFMTKVL